MNLYPAIDLRSGRAVRLTQGDYDRMTVYDDDPVSVARRFLEAGATHLHVVDLDAARSGRPENDAVIRRLAALPMFTEVGGGIRDEARLAALLDCGVDRAILGTVAVRDPAFVRRMARLYPGRVAVGVDARDGYVAVSGWEEVTQLRGEDFVRRLMESGVDTVIYTDIARDGAMKGANLELYRSLCAIGGLNVIASGGVSTEADVSALAQMGLYGAIIGKALYEGALDLKRCLALAKEADA